MTDAALRMDRMYRWQKHIYDVTRKPYLLGRDSLIESLAPPPGGRVLEIGCGTGRNLAKAARRWPDARYYGLDVSKQMLDKARASVKRAGVFDAVSFAQGDATNFDPQALFGAGAFHRIVFSYTLSMIPAWRDALSHAAGLLQPGAAILIADFGDQRELPSLFRRGLLKWLDLFDVHPRVDLEAVLRKVAIQEGLRCDFVPLYGGYAFLAVLRREAAVRF